MRKKSIIISNLAREANQPFQKTNRLPISHADYLRLNQKKKLLSTTTTSAYQYCSAHEKPKKNTKFMPAEQPQQQMMMPPMQQMPMQVQQQVPAAPAALVQDPSSLVSNQHQFKN